MKLFAAADESAVGTQQTSCQCFAMSALSPTADCADSEQFRTFPRTWLAISVTLRPQTERLVIGDVPWQGFWLILPTFRGSYFIRHWSPCSSSRGRMCQREQG